MVILSNIISSFKKLQNLSEKLEPGGGKEVPTQGRDDESSLSQSESQNCPDWTGRNARDGSLTSA